MPQTDHSSRSDTVRVDGGELAIDLRGPSPATARSVVVLLHGITANAVSWDLVAARLPASTCSVAVDLRGRGASSAIAGPWGIRAHVADLVALLDHLDVASAMLVGHSMGAYVAAAFSHFHPDRISSAVLVDGGVPLPLPEGVDPQTALDALLGPATARLALTFATRADYHAYWREHPALAAAWNPAIEAYLDHDLGGRPPAMRPRVVEAAVRADGADLLTDEELRHAINDLVCPSELVRVERGILDQPEPLIPLDAAAAYAESLPDFTVATVPGLNHYTITMSPAGADAVAAAVSRVAARA